MFPLSLCSHTQSLRATCLNQLVKTFSTSTSAKDSSLRTLRLITTLNPARIHADCRIDISSTTRTTIEVMDNMRGGGTLSHNKFVITYQTERPSSSELTKLRFPDRTGGFLYYHSPHNLPPSAGELRFRVSDSSFQQGQDLLIKNARPWRIPMYGLVDPPADLVGLRDQLLHEKLIAVDQLDACRRILQSTEMPWYAYTIHSFEQPWLLPLDQDINLWIVNNGTARLLRAQTFYKLRWDAAPPLRPLSGLLLVRFERSTVKLARKQRQVLVLRILDVIKPIDVHPDARGKYHMPQPGTLVPRSVDASMKGRPWYFDFDLNMKSPNAQALRLLCGHVPTPSLGSPSNSMEMKALTHQHIPEVLS
ncbi:hypothetical protein PC9H_006339 [Pleurotus ostreatus]|uniref:Uncharacterized protein n=1 Tax=Pleurotus ostreatus TaxID=5322 RepID=A0A8H6ZWH5_PLEOS|nr:uncharacterized protein PC9H_006339 [Pleurotus ostreatus]KAF7430630.1 hypothetical protein PC9H_006339 [Pleurotus ostreatus]